MFSIIGRYVFREITVSFVFCFAVFLVAGLIAGFLPLLQKGMEAGLGLTLILFQVLINALPGTLVTVLPLSIMMGILLGLGRMAADNEIAALKSAGISILRLLPPVMVLGLMGFALSLTCTLVLIPKGISEGRRLAQEALTERVDALIEERTFFDQLEHLVLYVENIDPDSGVMSRVFIRESSNPDSVRTIMAKKGKAFPDPERLAFILNLREGVILTEDVAGDITGTLEFESYVFRFPLDQKKLEASQKTFEELSIRGMRRRVQEITAPRAHNPELSAYYDRVRRMARTLIAQRLTYPLACLALALCAFPLGVVNMGRSRLNNVALGLVAMFAYYAFTLAAERASRSGLAPPEMLLPLPFLVFFGASIYLIWCVRMERIPRIIALAQRVAVMLRRGPA